ncbi:hypothetical protein H2198_001152 [Neophaeococcomyces mojaviensis]|uniref:Uncharacterized protein n=1 Tax=Neophaeococcomyces mojaviensis TaxID=3383035 RepID=A0ACC3AI10_9EURO|nr:hypothetical protein H2198_001152 [Knufia sp. JES_112]
MVNELVWENRRRSAEDGKGSRMQSFGSVLATAIKQKVIASRGEYKSAGLDGPIWERLSDASGHDLHEDEEGLWPTAWMTPIAGEKTRLE